MEKLLIILVFLVVYWLYKIIRQYIIREGIFLNSKLMPYHEKILSLLSPYLSTSFAKDTMYRSRKFLKELFEEYKNFSVNYRQDEFFDFYQTLFENPSKNVVNSFAFMYVIYSRKHFSCSELDAPAVDALRNYCADQLKKCTRVPEQFWDYFDLDKRNYT